MKFSEHLEGFISDRIVIAKGIFTLFKLEARLARLNIYPLILSLGVLALLIVSLWLTIITLVAYLMVLFTKQPLMAIAAVLVLNVGLLVYIIKNITLRLQQMSFKKTRACLAKPQSGEAHEPIKESIANLDCQNRTKGEACEKT
jgi:hypothetical protein